MGCQYKGHTVSELYEPDKPACLEWVGLGRSVLSAMLAQHPNGIFYTCPVNTPDARVEIWGSGNRCTIRIQVSDNPGGVVVTPASFEHPGGWGWPLRNIFNLTINPPLGTEQSGAPAILRQADNRRNKDVLRKSKTPALPAEDHTMAYVGIRASKLEVGNINVDTQIGGKWWMVSFFGPVNGFSWNPEYAYFQPHPPFDVPYGLPQPQPYVFVNGKRITAPINVLAARMCSKARTDGSRQLRLMVLGENGEVRYTRNWAAAIPTWTDLGTINLFDKSKLAGTELAYTPSDLHPEIGSNSHYKRWHLYSQPSISPDGTKISYVIVSSLQLDSSVDAVLHYMSEVYGTYVPGYVSRTPITGNYWCYDQYLNIPLQMYIGTVVIGVDDSLTLGVTRWDADDGSYDHSHSPAFPAEVKVHTSEIEYNATMEPAVYDLRLKAKGLQMVWYDAASLLRYLTIKIDTVRQFLDTGYTGRFVYPGHYVLDTPYEITSQGVTMDAWLCPEDGVEIRLQNNNATSFYIQGEIAKELNTRQVWFLNENARRLLYANPSHRLYAWAWTQLGVTGDPYTYDGGYGHWNLDRTAFAQNSWLEFYGYTKSAGVEIHHAIGDPVLARKQGIAFNAVFPVQYQVDSVTQHLDFNIKNAFVGVRDPRNGLVAMSANASSVWGDPGAVVGVLHWYYRVPERWYDTFPSSLGYIQFSYGGVDYMTTPAETLNYCSHGNLDTIVGVDIAAVTDTKVHYYPLGLV